MMQSLTDDDLATMRRAGKVASGILKKLRSYIQPGVTTKQIETFFDEELSVHKDMRAAFKGFMGYPASCCVSVNEEIIHGIPSDRVLKDGDLVSVDVGICYQGLFVDTAWTYGVGRTSKLARKLSAVTLRALRAGIKRVKAGGRIGDVAEAIQTYVEANGFSVIRKFVGHGIGRQLHLPPEVPNFGHAGTGPELRCGSCIAIEPMVAAGDADVEIAADGWTASTKDRSLAAHFEHTVAVTRKGAWVVTQ